MAVRSARVAKQLKYLADSSTFPVPYSVSICWTMVQWFSRSNGRIVSSQRPDFTGTRCRYTPTRSKLRAQSCLSGRRKLTHFHQPSSEPVFLTVQNLQRTFYILELLSNSISLILSLWQIKRFLTLTVHLGLHKN